MKQVTFQLFSHIQTYASIDFHFLNNFTLPPMEIVGSRTALNPLPHRMPLLRPSTHLRHLQPRLRPPPPQRLRQLPPPPPLPSLGTGINSPGYRLLVICRHTPTVTIRINLTVLQNRKSAYCSGSPMPLVRQSLVLRNSAVPEGNSVSQAIGVVLRKHLYPERAKAISSLNFGSSKATNNSHFKLDRKYLINHPSMRACLIYDSWSCFSGLEIYFPLLQRTRHGGNFRRWHNDED